MRFPTFECQIDRLSKNVNKGIKDSIVLPSGPQKSHLLRLFSFKSISKSSFVQALNHPQAHLFSLYLLTDLLRRTMKHELVSQYRASLRMLTHTIDRCPDQLWDNKSDQHLYWQIVYHSLHFTNFYLSAHEASFIPWVGHRPNIHQLGTTTHPSGNFVVKAYSKTDLQGYALQILNTLSDKINGQGLTEPSGFAWLSMNKFELHLYNLRHLQHHIGQLLERLHLAGVQGIDWIGSAYAE